MDVTSLEEPGMFHVFPILMPWADGSRRTYREVGEFVRAHLPDEPEEAPAAPSGVSPTSPVRARRPPEAPA